MQQGKQPGMQQGLQREMGLVGAVVTGLGSILGTGVFVSIGLAAGLAGDSLPVAILLAAGVATLNGLSSAQLAAAHPVSGGTYAYGRRYLSPFLGFSAGWLFLCAKSASAATAALGVAAYLLTWLGGAPHWQLPLALATLILLTGVVIAGLKRTFWLNAGLVLLTLAGLAAFIGVGWTAPLPPAFLPEHYLPRPVAGFWQAVAILFVAYTGYGRIATLGEEVREPAVTIPRAVILTLIVSAILYVGVAVAGLRLAGSYGFWYATQATSAPLTSLLPDHALQAKSLVALAALTAMLGVLLNLLLGLSRVWFALGRDGEAPAALGDLDASGSPRAAILLTAGVIGGLTLLGDIGITWRFSAFSVLLYYGLTNLCALYLPAADRRYPQGLAVLGLFSCLFLAAWIDWPVLLTGSGILVLGWLWRWYFLASMTANTRSAA